MEGLEGACAEKEREGGSKEGREREREREREKERKREGVEDRMEGVEGRIILQVVVFKLTCITLSFSVPTDK